MSNIPDSVPTGAIRFNTDSNKMECWIGTKWMQVAVSSPDLDGGARALIWGGYNGTAYTKNIDYFNIDTQGNAIDFGDSQGITGWIGACADRTRGLMIGDDGNGGGTNTVSYVTISSTGDAINFGDLTESKNYYSALASSTRGVRGGGYTPSPSAGVDTIDYCTIQSTGDFQDFGNLTIFTGTQGKLTHGNGVSSPTRGIWGGGAYYNPGAIAVANMDYITIATTGNAQDFGNLTVARKAVAACANSTRAIWSGGYTPTYVSTMDYATIATLGNTINFGDSTWSGAYKSGASSPTRGTWSGGRIPAGRENRIDYVSFATTGDAVDFGDLVDNHDGAGGCSNAHGGL